jgi:membrane protease YdiL (CAAX protease family)
VFVAIAVNNRFVHANVDPSRYIAGLARDFNATQILTATFEILALFFVWRITRRVDENSMVARYRPIAPYAFFLALMGGGLMAVLSYVSDWQLAAHSIVNFHVTAAEQRMIPHSPATLPLGLLCIAIVVPFAEELYFRGLLLSWLRGKMIAPLAAVLSAAIFALVHFRFISHPGAEGWVHTGSIAALGLVNATLALFTRSLWGPFAVHAGYNAVLISTAALVPSLSG